MASFRQRGNHWQVQVRRLGHAPETRSFLTKQEGEHWARSIESEIDQGTFIDPGQSRKTSLGELIERYIREVLPIMKGGLHPLQ